MTVAIAANAPAHGAPAVATPASANPGQAPIAGTAGSFASALATQQGASTSAPPTRPPAATPGKMLPPVGPSLAAPAAPTASTPPVTSPTTTGQTATGATTATVAREKSVKTDTGTASTETATAPDTVAPPPPMPEWNTLQPAMRTAALSQAPGDDQDSGAAAPARTARTASAITPDPATMVASRTVTPALAVPNGAVQAGSIAAQTPVAVGRTPLPASPRGGNGTPAQATAATPTGAAVPHTSQPVAPAPQPASAARSAATATGPAGDTPDASPAAALAPAATAIPLVAMATLTNPAVPTIAAAAPPETPTDFATLVDSIARARTEASDTATGPVGVMLSHADFGRVSLQFTQRDEGLSVTMRSADPGFAPAVAAATAASPGGNAGHHGDAQTGQQQPDTPSQSATPQNTGTGSGSAHTAQGDQPRHGARQGSAASPATARQPAGETADEDDIFA